MGLRIAIVGGIVAAVVGIVAVVMVLRVVSTVRSFMQRVLGDYYDYAAMFYVFGLTIVALLVFMYFVMSLLVWLLILLGVILVLPVAPRAHLTRAGLSRAWSDFEKVNTEVTITLVASHSGRGRPRRASATAVVPSRRTRGW